VCVGLYVALPNRLVVGPRWLVPVLVALPLLPLSARKHRHPNDAPWVRYLTLGLIGFGDRGEHHVGGAAGPSLAQRQRVSRSEPDLFGGVGVAHQRHRLRVVAMGNRSGGPHRRAGSDTLLPDVQFPQMENPSLAPKDWRPRFFDYLYTSFANGTSFAPADAMPLTILAKSLFAVEIRRVVDDDRGGGRASGQHPSLITRPEGDRASHSRANDDPCARRRQRVRRTNDPR